MSSGKGKVDKRKVDSRDADTWTIDLGVVRDVIAVVLDTAIARIGGRDRQPQIEDKRSNSGRSGQRSGQQRDESTYGTRRNSGQQRRNGNARHGNTGYVPASRSQRSRAQQGRSQNGGSPTGRTGDGQQRQRNGSGGRNVTWRIPVDERPPFPFDQGQTAQVFNCLPTLLKDSQGAALAAVIFLAMHQPHRYQGRALNDRTRLLTQCTPNPASLASASEAAQEMSKADAAEDSLSADQVYYDQQFMLLASGRRPNHSPQKIANEQLAIAEGFRELRHPRREASARIMAATILLVEQRDFKRAHEEAVKFVTLIGVAYPDETMIELAKSVNPELAEHVVNSNGRQTDPANFRG